MNRFLALVALCAAQPGAGVALAQVDGTLTANGKSGALKFAVAQEVDSKAEKGYMDVIVVLFDRKLKPADARNVERLEAMTQKFLVLYLAPARVLDEWKKTAPEKRKADDRHDILAHLGEPTAPPRIAPARGAPLWDLPDAGASTFDPHAQSAPE